MLLKMSALMSGRAIRYSPRPRSSGFRAAAAVTSAKQGSEPLKGSEPYICKKY